MSDNKGFSFFLLRRLISFLSPYKWRFIFLLCLTIVYAIVSPAIPMLIHALIDKHLRIGDYTGVPTLFSWMVAILVFQSLLLFGNTYLSAWIGQHVIKDVRIKLFTHILKLRLKFFDNTPIGQLVTRCVSDIQTLAELFGQGITALLAEFLKLIAIMAYMFYLNWALTLITLSVFPFLLFATYLFKESIKKSYNQVRNAVAKLNTFVQERITGMSIVQIFNAEEREYSNFDEINKEHRDANLASVKYYSIYFPVAEVLGAVGIGLIIWYGGMHIGVGEAGIIEGPGELIAFIMYLNMFFRPIRMIADRFNSLQMGIISAERIMDLLDNKESIINEGKLSADGVNGSIEFKNVWFAYNDEDYILKNLSLEVGKGKSVAIVGATGAGKSSTINLLSRLYELNKGEVLLDGMDVKEYDLASLRKNIGVVLQDVFLFSGSVKDNITLGDVEITTREVWEAIDMVGARGFIEKLPEQLDYNVRERGASLSVGQRQLISFIRVLVHKPKVLILDEATSSIDSETEYLIQNAIEVLMKGRTSIIIAHRLSTIRKADKIIVLEKGELVEQGHHEELIQKEGGYYKQLNDMQLSHTL